MQKTLDLYPMYGLWHIPFWQTTWFYYGCAVFIVILLLGLLWYGIVLYKSKKSKKSPWELAIARLTELRQFLHHNDGAMSKEFYVRLTIIIKNYLYARYGFDVESKTDEELIKFLEQTSLNHDIVQQLRTICEDGALAKFAPICVMHALLERDLGACIEVIKKTIPHN